MGSFKFYKETIIVLAFSIDSRIPQKLDQKNISSANFYSEKDTMRILILHSKYTIRGVINKFVSFLHRIIIYRWIYINFCHDQQQSVVNRKKTLKCKVWQTCDVTMTLMSSHVGDVVVKTPLEDRCGWCTLSGHKCYSASAIIVKFSDNICTKLLNAAQLNLIQNIESCRLQGR